MTGTFAFIFLMGHTQDWKVSFLCFIFAQIAVDQTYFVCSHCISYSVLFTKPK